MEEKLFYSHCINENDLIKSLALNGNDNISYRVFNLNKLTEDATIKSGFIETKNIISKHSLELLSMNVLFNDISIESPKYKDVVHFLNTMNEVRHCILNSSEEEEIDNIVNKHKDNKALLMFKVFISNYFEYISNSSFTDEFKLAHLLIDQNIKIYKEIFYFQEDVLSPLEFKLLSTIAEKVTLISLKDLYQNKQNRTKISSITPGYGIRNEVAHAIKDIINNGYCLDECQIVLINPSKYTNELYKYNKNNNFKISFGTGLPFLLTDAYNLLLAITKLENEYFFDVNGYLSLFNCESLDLEKLNITHPIQVAQLLGRMKICFDKEINDIYYKRFLDIKENHESEFKTFIEKIDRTITFNENKIFEELKGVIDVLSLGISNFIKKYTKNTLHDEKLFKSSLDFISNYLNPIDDGLIPLKFQKSYLESILESYICNETFNEGSIYVLPLIKAFSSIRKHVYILGMNSSIFPGSLSEDFLISDKIYEELSLIKNISKKKIEDKNTYLKNLIETYLNLGVDLHLSFNGQDFNDVRELNPCSVLLDYAEDYFKEENKKLKEQGDKDDALTKLRKNCSYYDDDLSSLNQSVKFFMENKDYDHKDLEAFQQETRLDKDYKGRTLLDKVYSPSSLPSFYKCPLKFYLNNIERADKMIQYDPLRPFAGPRFGDILHFVMETFIKKMPNATLNELLDEANNIYDLYTSIDRSISDNDLDKNQLLHSVENCYKYLTKNFVIEGSLAEHKIGKDEEELNVSEINGIHFAGEIDLITKTKEGLSVILDYKTASDIEHIDNDIESCIQGLIYSQLYEKISNKKIDKIIFFYTKFGKPIIFENPCSETNKNEVFDKISVFKNALLKKRFEMASIEEIEKGDVCKYCHFANICKKDELAESAISEEDE